MQLAPNGPVQAPALNILEQLASRNAVNRDQLNKLFDPLEQKRRGVEGQQLDLQSRSMDQLLSDADNMPGDPKDPTWKLMFDQLKSAGRAADAFDKHGNPKSRAALHAAMPVGEAGEFDQTVAKAQEGRVGEIADLQRTLAQARRGQEYVADTSGPNIVGPVAGSAPAQVVRRVQAGVGGGDAPFERQRELERIQNNLVLGKTKLLTGPISEKELAFLMRAVPTLTDTEETWSEYLKEFARITENQIAASQANLKAAPGAKMPGTAEPPAAASEPAEQAPVPVTSAQQALALPAGTRYTIPPDTTVYIAGQE